MGFTPYLIHLGILIGIYALLTLSLNLSVGFTGLLNMGHIAFFGIGAYTSALLSTHGYPLWISLVGSIILGALAGVIIALPTARLKGDYLALATLGFTFIMGSVARNWTSLTRGALGIPGIPKIISKNADLLTALAIAVVVCAVLLALLLRSRTGKVFQAVRDDELAAQTIGKNTFAHKILSLGISAGIAGLAGALYAHYITFIDPSLFGLTDLISLFSMLIVGGLASLPGSILGATIILLLPEPLRFIGFPSSIVGPARAIIFALLLLIILLYRPKGLFGKVDLA